MFLMINPLKRWRYLAQCLHKKIGVKMVYVRDSKAEKVRKIRLSRLTIHESTFSRLLKNCNHALYNGPAVKTKKEEIYREQLLI